MKKHENRLIDASEKQDTRETQITSAVLEYIETRGKVRVSQVVRAFKKRGEEYKREFDLLVRNGVFFIEKGKSSVVRLATEEEAARVPKVNIAEKQDNQDRAIVPEDCGKTESLRGKVAFSVALLTPGADFQTGEPMYDIASERPLSARALLHDAIDALDIMQGDLSELAQALFQAKLAVKREDKLIALKELSRAYRAYCSLKYWHGRHDDTDIPEVDKLTALLMFDKY